MHKMRNIIFTFLIIVVSNLVFSNSFSRDNNNRLSIGIGQFNFMEDGTPPHKDQSQMMNMELQSCNKMFNLIKPFAGFLYTTENTYYAYGGFGIDGYYGKRKNWVLTPALACGYYNSGQEIIAGDAREF